MRRWLGPASFLLAAAAPAGAATIVILPAPGSMSQPRVYSDGSRDDSIYVCTAPSETSNGRCIQKGGNPPRRH
jgi:hypothetical protein